MKEYNDIIINKLYQEISSEYNQNLKKYNVIMPNLYKGVKYTISALVLIYLYDHIGQIVSKQELTDFLRSMGYEINDMQQARHLAQQSGWYILSGTRGDSDTYIFLESKTDIHLQIGNSVPPILAEQIANTIIDMLNEVK